MIPRPLARGPEGGATMAQMLRLARLYFVLLCVFAVGRFLQGLGGVAYERGHQVFSIVILTFMASFFYGAFGRRWRGFRLPQAMLLAALMALVAQAVIFGLTFLSYGLGLQTYFNHPRALGQEGLVSVPLASAITVRVSGMVGNPILASLVGAMGWALGALLPEPEK
jgi:hypothetical protein